MPKASVLLLLVGGILGLGITLSFYGNQALFEDLADGGGDVRPGEKLEVRAELERSDEGGIYAIQVEDPDGGPVSVRVLDPGGAEVGSGLVGGELFEGRFAVDSDGAYTLVARNDGTGPVKVFAVMGPEPDAGTKSLGFVSLYVLVIGLLGMAGVAIFAVRNRKRP